MKYGYALVFISLSLGAFAQIPDGLLSVPRVLEEIKLPITNKILQMRQNFVEIRSGNVTTYTSKEVVTCQTGNKVEKGMPILRIVEANQLLPKKRNTKSYFGCDQKLSFREELTDGPQEFRYRLVGPNGKAIFSLFKTRNNNKVISELYIQDQRIYLIQEKDAGRFKEFFYHKYPFRLNFDLNGFSININDTSVRNGYYLVRAFPSGLLEIFAPDFQRVSKAEFIRNNSLRGINFFVEAALKDLPETKFINSGNRNQNLINELRNAQTFLLSNTNLNFVINLINEYIKLAEDGELQDNR